VGEFVCGVGVDGGNGNRGEFAGALGGELVCGGCVGGEWKSVDGALDADGDGG